MANSLLRLKNGWFQYEYYDTPEGVDIGKKLFWTTKYGVIAWSFFTVNDVLVYSKKRDIPGIIGRFVTLSVPFVCVPLAAVAVANISASIRQNNDKFNYFLGGLAGGGTMGAWMKSPSHGMLFAIVLGVVGMVRKDLLEKGYNLLDEEFTHPRETRYIFPSNLDLTITKDRRGDWSRE